MLDKNELHELFVRIKLGTVSVDNAIEEIERNFYDESESVGDIWKGRGFDKVIFCGGKSLPHIKNSIEAVIEKRAPFICVGLESDAMPELALIFDDVEFVYDAGVAVKVYGRPEKKNFKAVILTSSDVPCRVCREAETVLGVMGIETETVSGLHSGKLAVIKNAVKGACAAVVVSEGGALAEAVGASFSHPVVAVPVSGGRGAALNGFSGMFETLSSPWGISSVNIDDGFAAAMAVYRLAYLKRQ